MKIYWNGERKNVIGSRVKELRKKQDISQKILAAFCGAQRTPMRFRADVVRNITDALKHLLL